MVGGGRGLTICLGVLVMAGCAPATSTTVAPPKPTATPQATPAPRAAASALPPYAIATLRERPRATGSIAVKEQIGSGPGYTKYHVTWTSDGNTMTGVLDIPAGSGKFPVVLVNHGYAAVDQYYEGLDTAKYADPMASAGYLTISPSYPGYLGSGPPEPGVPAITAEAIADIDLISELPTLPQADPFRVAVAGHSNGGGVAEILMTAVPAVRAAVLYAPVSSDMADSARRFWLRSPGGGGGVPNPDSDPIYYSLMSPRTWFSPETPPALIMQGTVDQDIPAAWTAATVASLQAVGAPVKFVSFPGADHFLENADLARANSLAIDWLHVYMG